MKLKKNDKVVLKLIPEHKDYYNEVEFFTEETPEQRATVLGAERNGTIMVDIHPPDRLDDDCDGLTELTEADIKCKGWRGYAGPNK